MFSKGVHTFASSNGHYAISILLDKHATLIMLKRCWYLREMTVTKVNTKK